MVDRAVNFQAQEIRFLDQTITIEGCVQSRTLDSSWVPCSWSVICARTKDARNHMGNKRLRILVNSHLEKYANANRIEKGIIVSSIVDSVRNASNGGGFVKQTKAGTWVEVGDSVAREKVGQSLREGIAKKDPTKVQQRKEQRKANKASKDKKLASLVRRISTTSSSSGATVSTAETSAMTSTSGSSQEYSPYKAKPMAWSLDLGLAAVDLDPLPLESTPSTFVEFDLEGFQF